MLPIQSLYYFDVSSGSGDVSSSNWMDQQREQSILLNDLHGETLYTLDQLIIEDAPDVGFLTTKAGLLSSSLPVLHLLMSLS